MKLSMDRTGSGPHRIAVIGVISACLSACSSGASPSQTAAGDDAAAAESEEGSLTMSDGAPVSAPDTGPGDASQVSPRGGGSGSDAPATVSCQPSLPPVTTSTQYTCDPAGAGQCDNCGDCALVIEGTASTQVASCGTSCIGQPDSCITSCLSGKSPALSGSCQTCLVALFNCTTNYCAGPCITGTQTQCSACLEANPSPGATSCDSVFLQCAGLGNNPTYTGG
jgi:hypothetical protein